MRRTGDSPAAAEFLKPAPEKHTKNTAATMLIGGVRDEGGEAAGV
jgi:hypothetical protein